MINEPISLPCNWEVELEGGVGPGEVCRLWEAGSWSLSQSL